MNNISIVFNPHKCPKHDVDTVASCLKMLNTNMHQVSVEDINEYYKTDLLITLGGDGTIINAAKWLSEQTPIIGINYGKLGYLASFSLTEFVEFVKNNPTDNFSIYLASHVDRRLILNASIDDHEYEFINDFVIDTGPPFRMTEIAVFLGNNLLSVIRGDGIIISTPTGSTAYNMSAGGPIIEPTVDAIVITPKNPHKLSIRPIVVDASRPIHLEIHDAADSAYGIIDGQKHHKLKNTTKISVVRLHKSLLMINNPNLNYCKTLTTKLGWGA